MPSNTQKGDVCTLGPPNWMRRLVVWDMGAIAARGRPEDIVLFRKVLLASASLPVLLPPVSIPIDVDGAPLRRDARGWRRDCLSILPTARVRATGWPRSATVRWLGQMCM